jgi:serine/threonine protein kinase
MTLPMSFPLSQNDFTEFLFREKQVFELITNKFLYKNWKESQNYLIYKPSQSTQAKITFKGKLCNKILSLTEHFLMIFHESKGLELVILLQDFCVKVKNAEMSLFYFSKIGERLNFLFESAEICENFAKNLKKIRSFKDFYKIEKKIGSGKFSDVFLATEKNTGISFAVKIIRKRKMNRNEREMIRKEIEILGNLRHPGILCLKEVFESRKSVKIVAEYVIGVELIEIMKTRPADEQLARVLIKKILETLKFLHYSAVIHRDIKPENILVVNQDSEVQIKIIDYGLSTYFKPNELKKFKCGTLGYTAPEMLSGEYNEKVDVWSVGVVCFAFFTGKLPFFSYSLDEVVEMTKFKDPSFDFEDWKMFSKESRDFCFELLNKNPSERMSCEEALSHPWLQEDL